MKNKFSSILLILVLFQSPLLAKRLSDIEVYYKCFGQFVSQRPSGDDIRLKLLEKKKISGTEACRLLLETATFSKEGILSENNEKEISKSIVKTFHTFHNSWFPAYIFEMGNDYPQTFDFIEQEASALFVTKSLFSTNFDYSMILNGESVIGGIRTKNTNPKYFVGSGKDNHEINYEEYNDMLLDRGDLVGIKELQKNVRVFHSYVDHLFYPKTFKEDYDLTHTLGGGLLGQNSYLIFNSGRTLGDKMDGGRLMPRRYAQNVIKDLLCRDLPVVNKEDSKKYIVANSNLSFAKNSSCMTCHSTMDYMTGVLRNTQLVAGNNQGASFATIYVHKIDKNLKFRKITHFTDKNYYKSKPEGRFIYRALDNVLIDKKIDSLNDLGKYIAETDDFYSCATVRYYQFLTNEKINPAELAKNSKLKPLLEIKDHFKKHKSLRKMIVELMNLEEFLNE